MGPAVRPSRRASVEWPTLALCLGIYAGWILLTLNHAAIPWWLSAPLGAWLVAWHSSMQHEIVHGHPTRWRGLNRILASAPLSLWLPFDIYRIAHLAHHRDERLTDPLDDPESFYWTPERWAALHPVVRTLVAAQMTFAGRVLIGPAWHVSRFLRSEMRLLRGDAPRRAIWTGHVFHVAAVLVWLVFVCGMNPLFYVAAFVYPGTALLLVRSFAEHRAAATVPERTAIVENSWVLGPLFLFNNLHAAHHAHPTLPWYAIPAWYRANRERLVRENGGLVYRGYLDVARRYLLRPHDFPQHRFGRAP